MFIVILFCFIFVSIIWGPSNQIISTYTPTTHVPIITSSPVTFNPTTLNPTTLSPTVKNLTITNRLLGLTYSNKTPNQATANAISGDGNVIQVQMNSLS